MLNLHLVNKTQRTIPDLDDGLNDCYIEGDNVVTKSGNKISHYVNNELKTSHVFEEKILDFQYSDYFGEVIVICTNGFYQLGESIEQIIPISEQITNAKIAHGGSAALYSTTSSYNYIDLDEGVPKRIKLGDGSVDPIKQISFRLDNDFVAVSTEKKIFTLKIERLEKHGELDLSGISSISWNPLGSWIAVAVGSTIQFLEKNCCLRQSIEISDSIKQVLWSQDLDVLSALDVNNNIHIYYQKNRVFYEKIIIPISSAHSMTWCENLTLLVPDTSGSINKLVFNLTIDSDSKSIYVINGRDLQISNWNRSIIPPPLCHTKHVYDSQITAIASGEKTAVFTKSINFLGSDIKVPLPSYPVQTARYIDNQLYFAVEKTLYKLDSENIIKTVKEFDHFVGFISSNIELIQNPEGIFDIVDNVKLTTDGKLYVDSKLEAESVSSFIYQDGLLAYCHHINRLKIVYKNRSTERECENLTVPLYFIPRIFSVVVQMTRGNTETIAPHIIVEEKLKEMIEKKEFIEALQISKRYQIPFSRFIELGTVSVKDLTEQTADAKLRTFVSVLQPMQNDNDRCFIFSLISYLFNAKIESETNLPKATPLASKFYSVVCISLVLLNAPTSAVAFSCSIEDPQTSKESILFLLTLYDSDRLFDIALKTYDLRAIATVGMLTMREPSAYVPMLEDLKDMPPDLQKATIDDMLGDNESALLHYSKCGPEYIQRCVDIVKRTKLFDLGLSLFESRSEPGIRIVELKVADLASKKKNKELATAVITSRDKSLVSRYLQEVVAAGMARLAMPYMEKADYGKIFECLESAGRTSEAAAFARYELGDKESALRLYRMLHDWYGAVECGLEVGEAAIEGFEALMGQFEAAVEEAESLKKAFERIAESQKVHPESSKRKGIRRENRGLPPIVARLQELLPDSKKSDEVQQVIALLRMCNKEEEADKILVMYRKAVRSVWPIPRLPENEQPLIPDYLRGII